MKPLVISSHRMGLAAVMTVLLVFLWLPSVFSQPFGRPAPGYHISELHYTNSSGEKGISEFRYDFDGRLSEGTWYLVDSSRSSLNRYHYDAAGNLLTAFREFSDSLVSFETFEYDDNGNVVAEHFYRSDGRTGSATHAYSGGQPSVSHFNHHKGWLTGTMKYTCDSQGRPLHAVLINKDSVSIGKVVYQYDQKGNLETEAWNFNGQWQQEFRYVYHEAEDPCLHYSVPYLDNCAGRRIIREYYTYNGELGGPSFYRYGDSGRLKEKVFTRSDSLETVTGYTYDSAGRLVTSSRKYHDGRCMTFQYAYDDNNRLIQRKGFTADSLFSLEAYLYEGELLSEAFFLRQDGWLSGTIHFSHDGQQRLTGGMFTGINGLNAVIRFTTDHHGLVHQVKWVFPSGDYQEYTYEYTP
jgi:antitoxin component YwqK of YwqJK toxin-antitoxin module